MPILIAEKTGPHFAVGDTCYTYDEDNMTYNPDGKAIIARDNSVSIRRKEDISKAYFNCHTDITIPYDELGAITVIRHDGSTCDIIRDGRFVLEGVEELNKPLDTTAVGRTIFPSRKEDKMAKVGIVMGSDSDLKVMSKAADMLEELGIEYELTIISAHREPDELIEWTRGAEERDVKVIIAGAGMAAALPGAALFALPVIGVPLSGKNLDGMDAVFSIMQMPPGVPVATVAIDGAKNAAILAAKILAAGDDAILEKIKKYTADMKAQVVAKDAKLKQVGYKQYLAEK